MGMRLLLALLLCVACSSTDFESSKKSATPSRTSKDAVDGSGSDGSSETDSATNSGSEISKAGSGSETPSDNANCAPGTECPDHPTGAVCVEQSTKVLCDAQSLCAWDAPNNACGMDPAKAVGGLTDNGRTSNPAIVTESGIAGTPNIRIGMLVNDLNCTFCHLEVHGDVASVQTVPALREDSYGKVFGRWLVSGAFNARAGLRSPPVSGGLQVTGQLQTTYSNAGHELPSDKGGAAVFPTIDIDALATTADGSVTCTATGCSQGLFSKVYTGNVVLIGTSSAPIQLTRDLIVKGDLIIAGYYRGVGTIYATGNIYVPSNLIAVNKASFPYPDPVGDDYSAADAAAKADMATAKDALALASQHNIFIGDIENYMDSTGSTAIGSGIGGATRYAGLYDGTDALLAPRSVSGVENVYTWYPEAKFQQLYQSVTPCWTNSSRALASGHTWGERAFNEVDAFLYAAKAIGGVSRATNWTINGGIIAQAMHIISGAGGDIIQANASCGASRINFDYRMRNHMPLLGALAPNFSN